MGLFLYVTAGATFYIIFELRSFKELKNYEPSTRNLFIVGRVIRIISITISSGATLYMALTEQATGPLLLAVFFAMAGLTLGFLIDLLEFRTSEEYEKRTDDEYLSDRIQIIRTAGFAVMSFLMLYAALRAPW